MDQTPDDSARLARYAEYRAVYNGQQWEGLPRPGERRLTFNYARVFVNKAASYLMGQPPQIRVEADEGVGAGGQGSEHARAAEAYLAVVAAWNRLAAVDLETAISSATLGDGAWTVRWDTEARLPRVSAVDPAGLRARWRGDDLHTLLWVEQRYTVTADELPPAQQAALRGAGVLRADGLPLPAVETWTAAQWALEVGGVAVAGGVNPYGRIPYVLFPNLHVPGAFWGESDLVDLLGIQRDLNARMSVLSRILEVSGNPIAVVENVSDSSGLRVGPGQLWELPEGARAYLLDLLAGGGVQLHIDYLNLVYRAMHDVAEMPRTAFGDGEGTNKSGVALEIELQPLLHKLARKRLTWSVALEERARLILAVAALNGVRFGDAPLRLRVDWPAVLPQDRTALVAQETALVAAHIHSHQRALAALGEPDPAAEWARVKDEGEIKN
jgi:hypothetical protein